jgi:ketosteroid isomerase-like protein
MAQGADEKQIRTLLEAWAKAVRAKDMDGAPGTAHRRHRDVRCTHAHAGQGMDAYRKTWELFFASSPGGSEATGRDRPNGEC